MAMIAVQEWIEREMLATKLVMQVHDELVFEVPEAELARVKAEVERLMMGCREARRAAPGGGGHRRQLGRGPLMTAILDAAKRLASGGVVAFPTETVYGLGADATNVHAVAKIFLAKGRPAEHPLIVHVQDAGGLDRWGASVPDSARRLAERFWPGPLTLIVGRSPSIPGIVTGGQDTVGLRCPSHPQAQALLREFARIGSGAIAAPSANRFGHVSPTTAQHVRDEFGEDLCLIDGGDCEVGLESTILDVSRAEPVLLRPGAVSRADIEAVLGVAPRDPRRRGTPRFRHARRALRAAHGAPPPRAGRPRRRARRAQQRRHPRDARTVALRARHSMDYRGERA
jgi:L-threonylcarbamoyladenylate synthase